MARRESKAAATVNFGPVIKVVLLCFLFCGSAVGYVWQKNQIVRLGRQISDRERQLAQLRSENEFLRNQEISLTTQSVIQDRVQQLHLGLGLIQPQQVVRLIEATPGQLASLPALASRSAEKAAR